MKAQDIDDGGISDRAGNMADIFHTFFGIAGLSLLGYFDPKDEASIDRILVSRHRMIDPTYALPRDIVENLHLSQMTLPDES